ncbi:MAG: thioesterase family protein [Actinobacteria bacterium]|nr:thioesterase family protein [Actinomycetota bacterium]
MASPSELPDAVFHLDGDRFVPTELARGPWSPDAQHGGPPAALLGRAIERLSLPAGSPPSRVARVTVELLRSVPLAPLTVGTRVLRPGKKVQLVEAVVEARGVEVVRAVALRLRESHLDFADDALGSDERPPEGGPVPRVRRDYPISSADAVDFRVVRGGLLEQVGPGTCWIRLRVPLVAGEQPSPLQRVLAAADFGNGISSPLGWERYSFINPDLTVALHRPAQGEWIGLDATTWPDHDGIAVADTALFDERGRIGRSIQTLLLDKR